MHCTEHQRANKEIPIFTILYHDWQVGSDMSSDTHWFRWEEEKKKEPCVLVVQHHCIPWIVDVAAEGETPAVGISTWAHRSHSSASQLQAWAAHGILCHFLAASQALSVCWHVAHPVKMDNCWGINLYENDFCAHMCAILQALFQGQDCILEAQEASFYH